MNKPIKRWLLGIAIGFIVIIGFSAPAIADNNAPALPAVSTTPDKPAVVTPTTVPPTTPTTSTTDQLAIYGPIGGLITIAGTAIVWILKEVNNGKTLDVQRYKDKASEAESEASRKIDKMLIKMDEMEKKLDDALSDRDEVRANLETQKAEFNQRILAIETNHRKELEGINCALLAEIQARHEVERVLASTGHVVPSKVRPDPKLMRSTASDELKEEAKHLIEEATV